MTIIGNTRTCVTSDHAFLAPDSRVWAPLPGWQKSQNCVLISPAMGAQFAMYLAQMERGGTAGAPLPGVQRFVYVLDGKIQVQAAKKRRTLAAGDYAYLPADQPHEIKAARKTSVCVFEKMYVTLEGTPPPSVVFGSRKSAPGTPFLGDPATDLAPLLPDDPAFDMAINVFSFQPGAVLPFVEVHMMEHGLYLLEGQGLYRLGDAHYHITAGDVIWMAPYCPQWFVAYGKSQSAYLYYKDVNRDPQES